jgi:hypothetical protein
MGRLRFATLVLLERDLGISNNIGARILCELTHGIDKIEQTTFLTLAFGKSFRAAGQVCTWL